MKQKRSEPKKKKNDGKSWMLKKRRESDKQK
jgi:hypothetical protein